MDCLPCPVSSFEAEDENWIYQVFLSQELWKVWVAVVRGKGHQAEDIPITSIKCDNGCEILGKLSSTLQTVLHSQM
jgi:hypothetical protein